MTPNKVFHGTPSPFGLGAREHRRYAAHLNARNLIMICFEVQINGKKICRAGLGHFGVLSCDISWANNRQRPVEDEAKVYR